MHKIIGTDDSVNACECCGKSNLKFTFAVEVDGEVLHYGSTCVTKWTGRTFIQAKNEIAAREAAEVARKEKLYNSTFEAIQYAAAKIRAMNAGLVGKAFKEACVAERAAADVKRAEIFA
jgi:hypothetical protein